MTLVHPQLVLLPLLSHGIYTLMYMHSVCDVTVASTPLCTGIADLFDMKFFWKNVINWKDFGLAIGLVYRPTLKKIEMDDLGSIDDCKREMAAWLQQQEWTMCVLHSGLH